MANSLDLTNRQFNKLTAISPQRTSTDKYGWLCQCSCGNTVVVRTADLVNGHTTSCGCYQREQTTTHGMSKTAPYDTWVTMIRRCENPQDKDYPRYGGRGIYVCAEWRFYHLFYKWIMSNGYEEGLTVDRIDNNRGYSPQNCRLVTVREQQRNKRNTIYVDTPTGRIPLAEYAENHNINYQTAYHRHKRGELL